MSSEKCGNWDCRHNSGNKGCSLFAGLSWMQCKKSKPRVKRNGGMTEKRNDGKGKGGQKDER